MIGSTEYETGWLWMIDVSLSALIVQEGYLVKSGQNEGAQWS